MKRRILVRIVLVLILLLALYPLTKFVILPLFDTSGELEGARRAALRLLRARHADGHGE